MQWPVGWGLLLPAVTTHSITQSPHALHGTDGDMHVTTWGWVLLGSAEAAPPSVLVCVWLSAQAVVFCPGSVTAGVARAVGPTQAGQHEQWLQLCG
jgi:hypothetical protein